MNKKLTNYEQETIINFNKEEDIAHIFTYEKTWQKHLEGKLGLKPVMDNGFGGKEKDWSAHTRNLWIVYGWQYPIVKNRGLLTQD